MDIGTSTVKMVVLQGKEIRQKWIAKHHGQLRQTVAEGLRALNLPQEKLLAAVTGANAQIVLESCPAVRAVGEIPALVDGVRYSTNHPGSIIDIGGQGARFVSGATQGIPEFSSNEHCAGGTGSFFEDQMSRLGMRIEDYSETVARAESVPRLSGRCSVFAKTDIIHRQQEGVRTPDILLGLCYAMIRNYKATIVKNLPVKKPVVFTGGVTQNSGAVRAVREVFGLKEGELIIPEAPLFQMAIGCALQAEAEILPAELRNMLENERAEKSREKRMAPLTERADTRQREPDASGVIPESGVALGIDIGSTSTDLVLVDREGTLVDFQYLRTAGDPEGAVRKGLRSIRERFGEIPFVAVGVTGSGRERIGRMIGADAVRDEITAQAKAAVRWVPEADTVFEIGGQDSKFISLKEGEVADFQMNRICAAGTGSFIEEQAARMDIPLAEFGELALRSESPADLGERCTVFIETAIDSALAEGASQADIAAGLCQAIIRNYLHKVVGNKHIGEHIVLQGGVAYNPGIVAAFQNAFPDRLTVSPCFSVSGAYGAALMAAEETGDRASSFAGFDFSETEILSPRFSEEIEENIAFYHRTRKNFFQNYDGKLDPQKKTVGIPYALMIHKFFPMANAFFKALGYNVLLSDPSNEETVRLAQQAAQGETCYPVKLIYGHMQQLIDRNVDYIFMPNVRTIKHVKSHVPSNYGCVYMQTAAKSIADILRLEERGITLLNPTFDLDFGKEAMATAMLSVGRQLGKPKPLCAAALLAGARAVRQYDAAAEKLGQDLLDRLKPEDKVLVMITRNYGISDPVLNMGIPELLLQRGHKVINLEHLPAHDFDLGEDYPNLYWPFGQHILSGAKLIAHHPNLYAVYLTNHGCGPDTMLSYLFREEMGDKPYLQIEVDEHFSKVGVITRIEAFLNSLSHRETVALDKNFDLMAVHSRRAYISADPDREKTVYVPDFGLYTQGICRYLEKAYGVRSIAMPETDRRQLLTGRAETSAKEYLPFPALLGGVLEQLSTMPPEARKSASFLIPATEGAEADGQYARVIRSVLDRRGMQDVHITAPVLEQLPQRIRQPELLLHALVEADLLYLADPKLREEWKRRDIPEEDALLTLAETIGRQPRGGRRLAAVGDPLCQTTLNEGVLDRLEREGNHILRAPVSEALLFQWQEEAAVSSGCGDFIEKQTVLLRKLADVLGENGSFSRDLKALRATADRKLARITGGNIRYRFAKAAEMGENCAAVLSVAPRYENAAMVMEMRGLRDEVKAPLTQLYFDGDWDESAWARLRSFLYYC